MDNEISPTSADKIINELTYSEIVFTIIVSWILIALWQRAIDNFTFNYLKLSSKSTFHTTLIAITFTLIFLIYIFSFKTIFLAFNQNELGGDNILNI